MIIKVLLSITIFVLCVLNISSLNTLNTDEIEYSLTINQDKSFSASFLLGSNNKLYHINNNYNKLTVKQFLNLNLISHACENTNKQLVDNNGKIIQDNELISNHLIETSHICLHCSNGAKYKFKTFIKSSIYSDELIKSLGIHSKQRQEKIQ